MLTDHYPLYGIRLTTPRLELRLPSDEELAALGDVAAAGVHDPASMPFGVPWTDQPPAARARATVTHHWAQRAASVPERWCVDFGVFHDGEIIGTQGIRGKNFAILRHVDTGSWLGRKFHGNGFGTEMRAAVAHFAFAGLGAVRATSAAYEDNTPSHRVSARLGYVPNGTDLHVIRGKAAVSVRLLLTREAWERHRTIPVEIAGLTPAARAELGL